MSRTSKKGQTTICEKAAVRKYAVGIYARLSVDGEERKKESIETQIEIAKAFMLEQKDMVLTECYTDVGKTGTDFKRDGFERMMQDARMGRITCIIVKDLSRLGRNYIEVGNYIEKIFPFLGIRFIAVNDGFDSRTALEEREMLGVSLKNLVNEMYARDIAVKVQSAKKTKREQGSYTGGIPPYGYRAEWREDKKCLLPEETTALIVQNIYQRFLSGQNITGIVKALYENRVQRPVLYHQTGKVYAGEGEKLTEWAGATVKRILTNPVYAGYYGQGKHRYESLVSEEVFWEAAARFEKTAKFCNRNGFSKVTPPDEDIFAGVFFCGDCGARMHRICAVKESGSGKRVRAYSYNCPKAKRIDLEKCGTKNITQQVLEGLIKEAIRQEFTLSDMRPKVLAEYSNLEAEKIKEEWHKELLMLDKKRESILQLESEEYLKYYGGHQDVEGFRHSKEAYDRKLFALNKEKEELTGKLEVIYRETRKRNHFLRNLIKGSPKAELSAEAVQLLIKRIEGYEDHRVRIVFRFRRREVPFRTEGGQTE